MAVAQPAQAAPACAALCCPVQRCLAPVLAGLAPVLAPKYDVGLAGLKVTGFVFYIKKRPRVYLLDEDGEYYKMFNLVGQEFSFEVDLSKVPCTGCGSIYFVEMAADGGRNPYNPTGSSMGTGYCDAQCPHRVFINGTANPSNYGVCCSELDIIEASSLALQRGMLPCKQGGVLSCEGGVLSCEGGVLSCDGTACASYGNGGYCSKAGCSSSMNDYDANFFGQNKQLNTLLPMTIVTQFVSSTDDKNTTTLANIHQLIIQNGTIVSVVGGKSMDINDQWCPNSDQAAMGGLKHMGDVMQRGMTMVISMYDGALFLGSGQGPCDSDHMNLSSVIFSDLRWGEIGSTYTQDGSVFLNPA